MSALPASKVLDRFRVITFFNHGHDNGACQAPSNAYDKAVLPFTFLWKYLPRSSDKRLSRLQPGDCTLERRPTRVTNNAVPRTHGSVAARTGPLVPPPFPSEGLRPRANSALSLLLKHLQSDQTCLPRVLAGSGRVFLALVARRSFRPFGTGLQ